MVDNQGVQLFACLVNNIRYLCVIFFGTFKIFYVCVEARTCDYMPNITKPVGKIQITNLHCT